MSELGVTNDKDYAKSSQGKTYGEEKFEASYVDKSVSPEYQQVTCDKDYNKTSKLMHPDHRGHDHSENTSDGFKASPASPEYQQVGNSDDYAKNGNRSMFPSEKKSESVFGPMPKVM
jgi:hypothetical protein